MHFSRRYVLSTGFALAVLSLLAGPALIAWAGSLTETVEFDRNLLHLSQWGGYWHMHLQGADLTSVPGEPQVPVAILHLAIPPGSKPISIEVSGVSTVDLGEGYTLHPCQRPEILPMIGMEHKPTQAVPPDPVAYNSSKPCHGDIAELAGAGNMGSVRLAAVRVYPLQYVPSTGSLTLVDRLTFRLEYEPRPDVSKGLGGRPWLKSDPVVEHAKHLVLNPCQVDAMSSGPREDWTGTLPSGENEYVIITHEDFLEYFQPLVEWKTQKGRKATAVTTSWIDETYAGVDLQEKIRNFITDAYYSWGTSFVLLGGDTDWVSARIAWAMDCEAGGPPDQNDIRADLYYADLDGDWDADEDLNYGEVEDNVDLYSDVLVGRAPVNSEISVDRFVDRIITYEKNPPGDYQLDVLFMGEILWQDPYTDSSVGLEMIDDLYVPPRYDPITKLYESQGTESWTAVVAALNQGQIVADHCGHANYGMLSVGDGYLRTSDMDDLVNGDRKGIMYSIGCWPAAMDYNCVGEHFVYAPDGGGVAFIGNCRYGWGSPGNPGYGYSERFMKQFHRCLLVDGVTHIGQTLAQAKAHYVPQSLQENVYRWHQYQVNLLGDPEMQIWTDVPHDLSVEHADRVVQGGGPFVVRVRTGGGEPVVGALVVVMTDSTLYERGVTGDDGQCELNVAPVTPDSLLVGVFAQDAWYYQTMISVEFSGPYVQVESMLLDDSTGGNGDGLLSPGEVFSLSVSCRNFGDSLAGGVTGTLRPSCGSVAVIDSLTTFGDLEPGEAADANPPFLAEVGDSLTHGDICYLDLVLEGASDVAWTSHLALPVVTPLLANAKFSFSDIAGGDGDLTPEPGEEVVVGVVVANEGPVQAEDVTVVLSTDHPYVSVTSSVDSIGDLPAGAEAFASLTLLVDGSCPEPELADLELVYSAKGGYSFDDHIPLMVGESGFTDDMESGEGDWYHYGEQDEWHITDYRCHSNSQSWYCGVEDSWHYRNDAEASLVSDTLSVPPDGELSFWAWYEFTTYGADGVYVIIRHESGADTLDYLGSGGALGTLVTGNDWLEYTYDISHLEGRRVCLSFTLKTDWIDRAEGFYLDDVEVRGSTGTSPAGTTPPHEDWVSGDAQPFLASARPNPFGHTTAIHYSVPVAGPVEVAVYDVRGRLVRRLREGIQPPGSHQVIWDGRDQRGRPVSTGVYLYRVGWGGNQKRGKVILLR